MNTCLIVAFYSGLRTGLQNEHYDNYLNMHMNLYDNIKHNIKKIYFVIAVDNLEKEYFEENENNPKITFYFRKNKNLSFGSWVDIINMTNFDYYFLCEDDYFFIKDNFDTKLIDEYNKYKADYHVLWRNCEKDYIGKFDDELICTIGLISKKNAPPLKDYNNEQHQHCNGGRLKATAMINFLNTFSSISYSKNVMFPYYEWCNDSIQIYINNDGPIDSIETPEKFNEILNYDSNDDRSPILCCYQYLKLCKKFAPLLTQNADKLIK